MIGVILCWIGLHKWVGIEIPHNYECAREGCYAMTGGHP